MNKQPSLLFDTNIWLDLYLGSRKGHKDAMALYETSKNAGANILSALVSLKDVYYLVDISLKREAANEGGLSKADTDAIHALAWACIENMMECSAPIGADLSDAWHASKLRRIHGDFEDDLIIAAAQRANCDYLVTNDKRLLGHAPVAALSCKDALKLFEE